ncbi:hypothetical protein [Cupriavidus sp. CuC1]|uniref:hypothetical protein n=1 Tax=Cupriavidus sp. CuC1 TaxID=3373131 RepID=UPI0037D5123D
MKRTSLLLAFIFIASPAIAADKTKKTKEVERAAIPSVATPPEKPWEPVSFVLSENQLPAKFRGTDQAKFLKLFEAKVGALKKGEFETTEEFSRRTENVEATLAPITTSDLYAFRMPLIEFKYDADAQAYSIGTNYGAACRPASYTQKNWITCKVGQVSRKESTYTGSNAYGATREIDSTEGLDFGLAFPSGDSLLSSGFFVADRRFTGWYQYQDKLPVSLEKAKELKGKLISVLFVGQVTDAKIIRGQGFYTSATIDSPTKWSIAEDAVPFRLRKIIYYVLETGEILGERTL